MGDIIVSGAAIRKAGANVSTSIPNAAYVEWISGAECFLNSKTTKNWSSAYSTLSGAFRWYVADVVASLVAMQAINYDMSGYTSRAEAQTMLDLLRDGANRGIEILKDKEVQSFMS